MINMKNNGEQNLQLRFICNPSPFTIFILLLGFACLWLPLSWLADDAFITTRTVENFFYGQGWRWNPFERVQTYTHPLWFLLLVFFRVFISDTVLLLHLLSLSCSVLAIYLAFKCLNDTRQVVALVLLLLGSKAFMDYSSSGLENPLLHILVASFVWQLFKVQARGKDALFGLSFLVALAYLTRQDSVLLLLPALSLQLYRAWKAEGTSLLPPVLKGFSPAVVWTFFSLFYYGFPFPNTAYAKLSHGIPKGLLIEQGQFYLSNSLMWDPLTLTLIAVAFVYSIFFASSNTRALLLGVLVYLSYVVVVGGDYMSGRFLSVPYFLSAILLLRECRGSWAYVLSVIGLASVIGSPRSVLWINSSSQCQIEGSSRIADQRLRYLKWTNVLSYVNNDFVLEHPILMDAKNLKEVAPKVVVSKAIGMQALQVGADRVIVDPYALADVLLARLPSLSPDRWRIGHFSRAFPEGYIESMATLENRIKDSDLSHYYEKLLIITRQPLFSWLRLKTIIAFNLGYYDAWRAAYILKHPTPPSSGRRERLRIPEEAKQGNLCSL